MAMDLGMGMATTMAIGLAAIRVLGVGLYQRPLVACSFMKRQGNPSTFSPIRCLFNSSRFTPHKPIPTAPLGLKCKVQTAPSAELAPALNERLEILRACESPKRPSNSLPKAAENQALWAATFKLYRWGLNIHHAVRPRDFARKRIAIHKHFNGLQ